MSSLPLLVLLGVIGPWQVVIIVALILVLFGGKKIPELMRGMGRGIKEFKDAGRLLEAQRLQQRTMFDLEMLDQVGF